MKCPRNHGELCRVGLKSEMDSLSHAALCEWCGGVFLESAVAQEILGLSSVTDKSILSGMSVSLECPKCGCLLKCCMIVGIVAMYCENCASYWLDSETFPLLRWMHIEKDTGSAPDVSPLNPLILNCADCGTRIQTREEACLCSLGVVCEKCAREGIGFFGNKVHNFQMLTYKGMEVKIDHWSQSSRSRISVTPVEPCLIDTTLSSLSLIRRIMHLGSRKFEFPGLFNQYFTAGERILSGSPLHIFLTQPGVAPLFVELCELGKITIEFKPHNLTFDFEAPTQSTEIRLKFENIVRHILIAYTRFVSLSHLYG